MKASKQKKKLKAQLSDLRTFIQDDIWDAKYNTLSFVPSLVVYFIRIASLFVNNLAKKKIVLRASALAYTTLISIVPLLAVMFFLFKVFGGLESTESKIKAFIFSNLVAGMGDKIVNYIEQFMANVHAGAIGTVGFVFLILVAIGLISNVEKAFNETWGVKESRSMLTRFNYYWAALTIGPVIVALSLGLTASIQTNVGFIQTLSASSTGKTFLSLVPFLLTCSLFVGAYKLIPNTNVRLSSALIGGIFGASFWELAKYGYAWYTVHSLAYSKIYGSLSTIPVFLVWLFLTWVVVLLGAEVCFAHQNIQTYKLEKQIGDISYRVRKILSLIFLTEVCRAFEEDRKAPVVSELSQSLNVPMRVSNHILSDLVSGSFIQKEKERDGYIPKGPASHVSVLSVINYLQNKGNKVVDLEEVKAEVGIQAIFKKWDDVLDQSYGDYTIHDLIKKLEIKRISKRI